jgi:hypothetical protein
MGMEASAFLAYGIDFGEERPEFLSDFDGDLEEWVYENADDVIEPLFYFVDGHTVLAVKDHVRNSDYSSLVTEIDSLDVDAVKVEAFKAALVAAGYANPEPRWLLAFSIG